MKTFLLAMLMMASALATQAQRDVNWIHGLGGDSDSWDRFASDFNRDRQILTSTNNSYATGNGVGGMVQDIQSHIGAGPNPTAIAIGHSMGGVATRQINVQNTGRFGGIITFGAPLRGARVVNSVNNNVAADYVNNAIERLISGPRAELITMPLLTIPLLGTYFIDDFGGNRIVQQARDNLNLTGSTANDLAEESGYNQNFYGSSTGTPKLVYWGNEVSPINVRLAAGTANADEQAWVNAWNDIRGVYGAFRDINYTLRWTFIFAYPLYNWKGNEWAKGYNYLWDQSESEWSNLIGSGYAITQTINQYEFIGDNFDDYINCVGNTGQPEVCESQYFQWVQRQIQVFVRDQSDGLVPRRSQLAENTAWTANAEVYELPGNSHNEMRRSNESRNELTRAFDGNRGGGRFNIPYR